MNFFCNACEKDRDFDTEYSLLIICVDGKTVKRYCRECRSPKAVPPDVYWDGKPEHNLADDPMTGRPRVFMSKGQKAAYLKERGIMEAGDRVHGAPIMAHKEQERKPVSRADVQESLRKVRQMGKDVRRQEYLRIQKEARERRG